MDVTLLRRGDGGSTCSWLL